MTREGLATPYKHLLGRLLAWGWGINDFAFPTGAWPPPTPARKYIDEFLTRYQRAVHGRCVEFAPPIYRTKFIDQGTVTSYDIWDVKPGDEITIVEDLQNAHHLPDASFDTIICTHVLCAIPRPWLAVAELYRLLSPSGVVLCTNPVVLQNYAPDPRDCWRFTPDSMKMLFADFATVHLHCFGNALTVAGSPLFLMDYHFPRWVLERHDRMAPSIVAAAAWKERCPDHFESMSTTEKPTAIWATKPCCSTP